MAVPHLAAVPEPMTRDHFAAVLSGLLGASPAARQKAASILAAADEYAACMIEQHARPPSKHWGPTGKWAG